MRYAFLVWLLIFSSLSLGASLEDGKVYRLLKSVTNIESVSGSKADVFRDSKFLVIDSSPKDHYVVRFIKIYKSYDDKLSTVTLDNEYKLKKEIDGVSVEKSTTISRGGMVSGPLIVPFKYRIDKDTLSGEAAIGYYAGYSVEPSIGGTRIPITPFLAGGLSQVGVNNGEETENKTGVTVATGILIQNWAGVNIGLVYGQDRIGDKTWEHEGEGWVSLMVGWEI